MILLFFVFFFKQKTAYELRISDWSSDVCSSDLAVKETAGSMAMDEGHRQWSQRVRLVIGNAKAVPSPGGLGGGEKGGFPRQIGRASCRERVCQYVWISVVDVSLQNNSICKYVLQHIVLTFAISNVPTDLS